MSIKSVSVSVLRKDVEESMIINLINNSTVR